MSGEIFSGPFSTALVAERWAMALLRTGERVRLKAPSGEAYGETWVKLKSLPNEPLIATADGLRYEARLSPLLLPQTLAEAALPSLVLERAGGEILRAHGALGRLRQGGSLIAYRLCFAGN